MFFRRIYEEGLAQASYMIGCQANSEAMVIDPRRDVDVYLDIAEQEQFNITYITETHIHADFLSGTRELAKQTGAEVLLSGEGGSDWAYSFDHKPLRSGDTFHIGNLQIDVLHTPGHTPEHLSYLLTDTAAGTDPLMLFSGDFVFVGDVGRPDLLEEAAGISGTKEFSARQMFRSLQKFKELPGFVQVWPGHGAGSACGKKLGALPVTTVGYEMRSNWALQVSDEDAFVDQLLAGQPEPPRYFAMMKKLNKEGPAILGGIPHPARLNLKQFQEQLDDGIGLIDTRDKMAFAGGYIEGSLNIPDNSAFATWAGWMLDYDRPFMLIANEDRIPDLTRALIRIGLDHLAGYLPGLEQWTAAGLECRTADQVVTTDVMEMINRDDLMVIDVRNQSEYEEGHLPGAVNIHAGRITDKLDRIPKDRHLVLYCHSGDRSSTAASVLRREGFTRVSNLAGGIKAWNEAHLPLNNETHVQVLSA